MQAEAAAGLLLLAANPLVANPKSKNPKDLNWTPVQAESTAGLLLLAANPLVALPAAAAAAVAMVAYGACLAAGTVALKWALAGRVEPGVHRCSAHFLPPSFRAAPLHTS